MQLVKPSVEYIPQEESKIPYKHIELCARVCYKSEDRITTSSAKTLVDGLIMSGHFTMLEHGTIYMYIQRNIDEEACLFYEQNPYSKVIKKNFGEGECCYITTNMRVLIESGRTKDVRYSCFPTGHHIKRYTMKFTCARIDSQSITRYRTNSYAQESQRVINYLQEIRGASVTFSEPVWVKPEDLEELKQDAAVSEQLYFKWLNKGYKPEEARYFLINGTKTEIIVTAFEDDWSYFLDQRLRNTTGKPSSDMHHLAQLLWNEFKDKLNLEL